MNKIRRIDDLGRVMIPKEIRRILGISEGDPLEINVNTMTGQIIIEKYKIEPRKRCNWCSGYLGDDYKEGSEEGIYYHPECWRKVTMLAETIQESAEILQDEADEEIE